VVCPLLFSLLVEKGRLELSIDVSDWVRKTEGLPFVRFAPLDNTIALRSVSLPVDFHADPADRIITATAMTMGIPLVTGIRKLVITGMLRLSGQISANWSQCKNNY